MGVGMEKPIVFILPCDMTIKSIADIYSGVAVSFRDSGKITIDCSKVSHCDISSVQLLVAARNSARAKGLDFRLTGVAGALSAALVRAGISPAQLPDSILNNGA